MSYSEQLTNRIKSLAGDCIEERRMFGGVAFMHMGNMAVGVSEDDLMVRVGPDAYEEALSEPGVGEFAKTGRPMKGWVLVSAQNIANDDDLRDWVEVGLDFAASLPPK